MKKYLLLALVIIVLGFIINYSLGGFANVKPALVNTQNYIIYGVSYSGGYKDLELINLVDGMHEKQQNDSVLSTVVIVNYINELKETIGDVENFVGLSTINPSEEISDKQLIEKIIYASKAIRIKVAISPLVMPSPEKIKRMAFDLAVVEGVELQGLSIEQYDTEGFLTVDFPVVKVSVVDQLAEAYGLSKFDSTKTYRYTFNVKKGEVGVARSWTWQPSSGDVQLIENNDTLHFNHKNLKVDDAAIDHKFINDKYWLFFPFQLKRDTGFNYEVVENQTSPISGIAVTKLTITYNNKDGYTPGDAYDFYINSEPEIIEWTFRKGGQEQPSLITTWENYELINGLKIATDHFTADKGFRLWFSEIKVN